MSTPELEFMATESSQGDDNAAATFLLAVIERGSQPRNAAGIEPNTRSMDPQSLVLRIIEESGGHVFRNAGNAVRAVYTVAASAVEAAMKVQSALPATSPSDGPDSGAPGVRIVLHSGVPECYGDIYSGPTMARLGAMADAAQRGQVLVSESARELIRDALPLDSYLCDLGMHGLSDSQSSARIWQLVHPTLPKRFPNLKSRDLTSTNIPRRAAPFVGRKGDIARIRALLRSKRLVTLVGESGIGKTRLAEEVGLAELEARANGVWIIALEGLRDPEHLPSAIACTFRIREVAGRPLIELIANHFSDRNVLVILDAGDRLRSACANLVRTLLPRCPGLTIMITGLSALDVEAETIYRVAPMGLPPSTDNGEDAPAYALVRYDAVRVFIERARSRRPNFELNPALAPVLCRLCHRLGGIPFAIELAAARTHELSIEQMTAYLDSYVAYRTGNVHADSACADRLSIVIAWSFAMLSIQDRIALLRLSVFSGGWELAEAEAVCSDAKASSGMCPTTIAPADISPILQRLVHGALVTAIETHFQRRYSMSMPVLEFCRRRREGLREDESVRARHSAYFYSVARQASDSAITGERSAAMGYIKRAPENLRAALDEVADEIDRGSEQSRAGAAERLLRFAAALAPYWENIGAYNEGTRYLELALAAEGARDPSDARALALLAISRTFGNRGEHRRAEAAAREALEYYRSIGDRRGDSRCLQQLAALASDLGWLTKARAYSQEAVRAAYDVEDRNEQAEALETSAHLAWIDKDLISAIQDAGDATAIHRAAGYDVVAGSALQSMGESAMQREDLRGARSHLTESLTIWRGLGDRRRYAKALEILSEIARRMRRPDEAAALILEAGQLRCLDEYAIEGRLQDIRSRIPGDTHPRITIVEAHEQGPIRVGGRGGSRPNLRLVEGGKASSSTVPTSSGSPVSR